MASFDHILQKFQLSDVDRRIAADLAEKYGDDPRFADRFESFVAEYANCMARVEAGEIAPEDVAEHMTGAAEMLGTAPDLLNALQGHFDREMPGELASAPEEDAEPEQAARQTPSAPPPATAAPVRPVMAAPDNDARIAEIETKYMRAPRNTPEGKAYWEGGIADEYRALIAAREAADAAPTPAQTAPES